MLQQSHFIFSQPHSHTLTHPQILTLVWCERRPHHQKETYTVTGRSCKVHNHAFQLYKVLARLHREYRVPFRRQLIIGPSLKFYIILTYFSLLHSWLYCEQVVNIGKTTIQNYLLKKKHMNLLSKSLYGYPQYTYSYFLARMSAGNRSVKDCRRAQRKRDWRARERRGVIRAILNTFVS